MEVARFGAEVRGGRSRCGEQPADEADGLKPGSCLRRKISACSLSLVAALTLSIAQRTPQRLDRRSLNAAADDAVAPVVKAGQCLCHAALLHLAVRSGTSARPVHFSGRGCTRPEKTIQHVLVGLLAPQRHFAAEDARVADCGAVVGAERGQGLRGQWRSGALLEDVLTEDRESERAERCGRGRLTSATTRRGRTKEPSCCPATSRVRRPGCRAFSISALRPALAAADSLRRLVGRMDEAHIWVRGEDLGYVVLCACPRLDDGALCEDLARLWEVDCRFCKTSRCQR
jgi:hypothetical protein